MITSERWTRVDVKATFKAGNDDHHKAAPERSKREFEPKFLGSRSEQFQMPFVV